MMATSYEQYDKQIYKKTIKRVVEELEEKIKSIILRPKYNKPDEKEKRLNKVTFFDKYSNDFYMSKHTYYKYMAFSNDEKSNEKLGYMRLDTFYNICKYTNVSADYLLGFINNTKRKDQSADMVAKEFGLSDPAMERLKNFKNRTPEQEGELSSDLINFILENDVFWDNLNEYLPLCVMERYGHRQSNYEAEMAKFTLNRIFGDLIDEICDYVYEQSQ